MDIGKPVREVWFPDPDEEPVVIPETEPEREDSPVPA